MSCKVKKLLFHDFLIHSICLKSKFKATDQPINPQKGWILYIIIQIITSINFNFSGRMNEFSMISSDQDWISIQEFHSKSMKTRCIKVRSVSKYICFSVQFMWIFDLLEIRNFLQVFHLFHDVSYEVLHVKIWLEHWKSCLVSRKLKGTFLELV